MMMIWKLEVLGSSLASFWKGWWLLFLCIWIWIFWGVFDEMWLFIWVCGLYGLTGGVDGR